MSILPTNLAQSAAGLTPAEQADAKSKAAAKPTPRRTIRDEFEQVTPADSPEAIRRLAGVRDEETHEEHERRPDARAKPKPPAPHLDVQG